MLKDKKIFTIDDVPELNVRLETRQDFVDFFKFLSENYFSIHGRFFRPIMRKKLPLLLKNGVTVQKREINLPEEYHGKKSLDLCEFSSGEGSIAFGTINSSIWWLKINNAVVCLDSENDIDKVKPRERVSAYLDVEGNLKTIIDAEFSYKRGETWNFKVGTNEDLEKTLADLNKCFNTIIPRMNQQINLIEFNDIIVDKKLKQVYIEAAKQKRAMRPKIDNLANIDF